MQHLALSHSRLIALFPFPSLSITPPHKPRRCCCSAPLFSSTSCIFVTICQHAPEPPNLAPISPLLRVKRHNDRHRAGFSRRKKTKTVAMDLLPLSPNFHSRGRGPSHDVLLVAAHGQRSNFILALLFFSFFSLLFSFALYFVRMNYLFVVVAKCLAAGARRTFQPERSAPRLRARYATHERLAWE